MGSLFCVGKREEKERASLCRLCAKCAYGRARGGHARGFGQKSNVERVVLQLSCARITGTIEAEYGHSVPAREEKVMRRRIVWLLSVLLFVLTLSAVALVGCGGSGAEPPAPPSEGQDGDKPAPDDSGGQPPVQPSGEMALDVVLFIGQSNMAGRGNSAQASKVEAGHAYEFRAVSDPTKLYPLQEPFGAAENNAASGVSENKKTGSLVSAFCESYYSVTGAPLVAVSCAKGGEAIDFFDVGGTPYADACARVLAAQNFLKAGYEAGEERYVLGDTYVVWLQGESDGDRGTTADSYVQALDRIVHGFRADVGCKQFFVIPIGGYNGADGKRKAQYNAIRDAQILYCDESAVATVVSRRLFDLYSYGYMKDEFHYTQEGYNIVGADAGANMGRFVRSGEKPECTPFFPETQGAPTVRQGAWMEKDGKVVIPAAAAMEESRYANYTSNKVDYSWAAYSSGGLAGIVQTPATGAQWTNIAYAFADNPQVHYTFQITSPGRYYLYMLTSYPDTGSNSVFAGIDGDALIDCSTQSYERGLWLGNERWAFDLAAGEHTLTIYAREDGVVLNQFVLSTNAQERFTKGVPEEESARAACEQQGAFVEVNGRVNIELSTALEDSSFAYRTHGSALGQDDVFRWERSAAFDGMQVYPDRGVQWSTNNISPKLSYRVQFSTPGTYYVMLYTSFAGGNSDSVFVSVNDGPIVTCLSYLATGVGKWMADSAWKIEIPYAGVHTINLFAREDGARVHKLYLTNRPVVCRDPNPAPRISLQEGVYSAASSGALIAGEQAETGAQVRFPQAGRYCAYLSAEISAATTLSLRVGTHTFASDALPAGKGWNRLVAFTIEEAGEYTVRLEGAGGVRVRCLNLVGAQEGETAGVQTLVIGDSYTSKTAWKRFDEQTRSIGGITIGIGGTKVALWSSRAEALAIYAPQNIVINIGVNDIDGGISGEECGNSIVALLKQLRALFPNTKIFYMSICDNESYPHKWGEYARSNAIVRDYMAGGEGLYFVDFAAAMKEAVSGGSSGVGFRDGLHLNDAAYELYSKTLCDAVLAANAGE